MARIHIIVCSILVAIYTSPVSIVHAEERTVRLTSLDWPPYTSETPPHGISEDVVRRVFKAAGYDLDVVYMPWNRAVETARTDPDYDGYFPEYFSKTQERQFIFSLPIGNSPIVLAEPKAQPVTWTTPDDLAGLTLGNVSGYVLPPSLTGLAASAKITIDKAQSDTLNLKKVAAGRIRAAIIDRNVMDYLLKTESALSADRDKLQWNARGLDDMPIHICFRRDARGQELAGIFNAGLKRISTASGRDPR